MSHFVHNHFVLLLFEPQSYRKSHKKAPDKTEKVSAEVKVLTNVQGFCEYLEEKGCETAVIATKVRSPIREGSPWR